MRSLLPSLLQHYLENVTWTSFSTIFLCTIQHQLKLVKCTAHIHKVTLKERFLTVDLSKFKLGRSKCTWKLLSSMRSPHTDVVRKTTGSKEKIAFTKVSHSKLPLPRHPWRRSHGKSERMYLRATRAGKAAREETPSTSLPLSRSGGYGQCIMTSFPRLSRLEFASRFNSVGVCRLGDLCFHFAAWVHVNTDSSAADAYAYAGGEQQ